MIIHKLIVVILTAGFSVLAFAPTKISARFLRLSTESKLWVKLAGFLGLLGIGLSLAYDYSSAFEISLNGRKLLLLLKHYCSGIIVGLFVAIMTKRYEKL